MLLNCDFCGSNNFDWKCSKKFSMSFLWSEEYKLHFEKFLSNSVDMVKNLHQDQISFCSSYSLCWAGTLAQGSNSRRRQGSPHRCCRSHENLSTQLCWRVRKLFSWRLLEKRPQQPHQTASIQLEPEQVKMLDEATKHIREAIMLGRTDIIKKLLEEVWCSLSEAKGKSKVLSNKVLWWPLF